jgi:hypothetical protein
MNPIRSDESLDSPGSPFRIELIDGHLHASPRLAALLRRLGVNDASLVLATFDEMPSAFMGNSGCRTTNCRACGDSSSRPWAKNRIRRSTRLSNYLRTVRSARADAQNDISSHK